MPYHLIAPQTPNTADSRPTETLTPPLWDNCRIRHPIPAAQIRPTKLPALLQFPRSPITAYNRLVTKLALLAFFIATGTATALDFRGATIVIPAAATPPQKTAARMLSEEITKRTQLKLNILVTMPAEGPVIFLRTGAQPGPEGFTLTTSHENERPIATVKGFDDRGVIFGAGYLLRQFRWAAGASNSIPISIYKASRKP